VVGNANEKFVFVVDLSGSMSGTAIEKSKASMIKLAKTLYAAGATGVALVGSSESCGQPPILKTVFYERLADLSTEIIALSTHGNNSIPNGYSIAQGMLNNEKASSKSKVFLFGDGDGLNKCDGFKNINEKIVNKNKTVYNFSYIGLDWTAAERTAFTNEFKKLGQRVFDWDDLVKPLSDEFLKQGLNNAKFLDKSGNVISKNMVEKIACLDAGNIVWELKQQDSSSPHYIRRSFVKYTREANKSKRSCQKKCSVSGYIKYLNDINYCGVDDWRLPDIKELRSLRLLSPKERMRLLQGLRKWPHISGSKGSNHSQILGINFEDNIEYDFLETKAYSAIMVGYRRLESLIKIPDELLVSQPIQAKVKPQPLKVLKNPAKEQVPKLQEHGFEFTIVVGEKVIIDEREVDVPDFQVSKFEVSVSLFQQFVDDTQYQADLNCEDHNDNYDRSWKYPEYKLKDNAPITCINVIDIKEFIKWFSKEKNVSVRLPTLAEWMLFAKEEISTSAHCTKDNLLDAPTANRLNIMKSYECNDGYFEPALSTLFPANNLGLYNVRGNVSEVISLCNITKDCGKYGVIGESWRNKNDDLVKSIPFRSSQNDIGFRLILEL